MKIYQKLIWGRFYQVNDSRNKKVNKGFGLGLSLVAKIIEQHKELTERLKTSQEQITTLLEILKNSQK